MQGALAFVHNTRRAGGRKRGFLLHFFFFYGRILCGEFETFLTEGFCPKKQNYRRTKK
jgi:hypothetical protein